MAVSGQFLVSVDTRCGGSTGADPLTTRDCDALLNSGDGCCSSDLDMGQWSIGEVAESPLGRLKIEGVRGVSD